KSAVHYLKDNSFLQYNLKLTCTFLFLESSSSFPQLFLDFSFPTGKVEEETRKSQGKKIVQTSNTKSIFNEEYFLSKFFVFFLNLNYPVLLFKR
ncbi:hypothetical protein BpHYR1_039288, partial [Brachionus plicatilis]